MLVRKCILLYILVLALIINVQSNNGDSPGDPHPVSEVNLNITSDRQNVSIGEAISIYFNFTNIKNSKSKEVNLNATISHFLEAPQKRLDIDDENNTDNDSEKSYIEICSNFGNHHSKKGDYAFVTPEGTIVIHFPHLDPKEAISIKYRTKRAEIIGLNKEDICKINDYDWRYSIQPIKGNNKNLFYIVLYPKYNITNWRETNCTMFENTKIYFYMNFNSSDEDILYLNKAKGSSNSIKNGSELSGLGLHQFEMKINGTSVSEINNSYFNVINIIKFHKEFGRSMIGSLLIMIALLIIYYMIFNSHKKGRIYLISIFSFMLIEMGIYKYYILSDGYYRRLVFLESAMPVIAFFLCVVYLSNKKDSENLFQPYDFVKVTIGWTLAVFIFNFYLPEILYLQDSRNLLIFVLILFLILIALYKFSCTSDSPQEQKGGLSLIVMVLFLALVTFCIKYFANSKFIFKPEFEISDICIIELLELSFLIMTVAIGSNPVKFLELLVSKIIPENSRINKYFKSN